jgi:putative ubiquitin-RnfH superfamily antitoxin RatB of RatAB toxin-antitoxin module
MRILVVVALPEAQDVVGLELGEGATVAQALDAAQVSRRYPGLALDQLGVWGRPCDPDTVLREADRVEVYRPIAADAKKLRRARAGLSRSPRSRSGP